MSITNFQLAQTPSYTDYPFHNYGVTDLPSNIAVVLDAAHDIATNSSGLGAAVVGASGDPVIGVTLTVIPAGGNGTVRCFGPIAQMSADGAITAGTWVEASAGALKVGYALAAATGKTGIGLALNATTSDGDLVLVMLTSGYNG